MAEKICAICGKRSWVGGKRKLLRGHYNPTMKVRRRPNLQWTRLPHALRPRFRQARAEFAAGPSAMLHAGTRVRACAKCIKAFGKTRS